MAAAAVPTGRRLVHRPLIMLVTDRRRSGEAAMLDSTAAASAAGVDLIQVRERGLEDVDLLGLTVRVRDVVAGRAHVLVNDRVDVALAAGAAGVHLPGRGVVAARIRPIAPASFLLGRSVHSVDDARQAERSGGCDYLVFGSVFETASKPAAPAPAGLEQLSRVCAAVALPVLAIGGVTVGRVAGIARAGAAGIAAIGLFTRPERIAVDVADIREIFSRGAAWPRPHCS
jgi:thiamine-phosphate diphosphorylase